MAPVSSTTTVAVGDPRGADRGLRYLAYAMVGIILLFMTVDQLVWGIRTGGIWGFLLAVTAACFPLDQTIPQVIFILVIASMAWRRESKIIAEHLRDEQASGAVTAEEYAVISSGRERRRLLHTLTSRGPGAWLALRQLYDLQTELAFRKWYAMRGEWMPTEQRETSEEAYRVQIRALRTRITDMGVATA